LRRFCSCSWIFKKRKGDHFLENSQAFGREGERQAEGFLRKNGYIILIRNFRPQIGGEVDLVCRERVLPKLVFVEVKTRRGEDFGSPSVSVNLKKQKRLILAAQYWLSQLERTDVTVRFDVIEVIFERKEWKIRHIVSAFSTDEN
jgi:putative endonuclease